jgi:hypothetical protein
MIQLKIEASQYAFFVSLLRYVRDLVTLSLPGDVDTQHRPLLLSLLSNPEQKARQTSPAMSRFYVKALTACT